MFEVLTHPHHWLVGKKVSDIELPGGILIAIIRNETIKIPRRVSLIKENDRIVIFSKDDRVAMIKRYLGS